MRIDKYTWSVRIFKTRSVATKACVSNKIKLNGEFVKPSKLVKQNDVVAIKNIPIWKSFKVISLPKTRVGAKLVRDFTLEITSEEDLELLKKYELINRQNRSKGIKGRPTKKDRRNLGEWMG